MKLQYLGTAAAEGIPAIFCECENCKKSRNLGGRNIRTRSQAIIDDKLLIDFPADTYMHFLKYNMPLYKISSCIITHSHADHIYPEEVEMRKKGFSHVETKTPLTFYSDRASHDRLTDVIKDNNISETDAKAVLIKPYEPFIADGYKITALRASHALLTSPVVYIIEKGEKSMLYSHDSSEYNDEAMKYLKEIKKPINLVSLDCTEACNKTSYVGHLSFERCIKVRDDFIENNIADSDTIFVLNHFSHNGKNVVYDEFVKIAEKYNFIVSYDGMIIDF